MQWQTSRTERRAEQGILLALATFCHTADNVGYTTRSKGCEFSSTLQFDTDIDTSISSSQVRNDVSDLQALSALL